MRSESSAIGVAAFITAVMGYTLAKRGRLVRPANRIDEPERLTTLPIPPIRSALLDLPVPMSGSIDFHNILVANDISLEKAIQEISDTLYIFLHLSPATNREGTTEGNLGDLRFYMSDLYCQCWDLCCLHKNLGLDVRILHEGGGYIARRELMVNKDLEVILGIETNEAELVEANVRRQEMDFPPLRWESLASAVRVALNTPFLFSEDHKARIPIFSEVVLGGTFDRLHNGHKKLLSLGASIARSRLTIGVTSSEMLKKKKNAEMIASVEERIADVQAFLRSTFPSLKTEVVKIEDPFGPPIHLDHFDAIVVSSETIPGAVKINEIRESKGFRPLEIVVTRRTTTSLLSSTFIRENMAKLSRPKNKGK